ncbi:plasmid maintenance system killer protein [Carnobacterium divergens]|uniref:plasmid maintenance system killer protein n=1 Tax=Carnobacterium divergens TaxID=2748 RepID=UPI0039B073E8
MNIVCKTQKMSKIISDEKSIKKTYGNDVGSKLIIRISELRAANNLGDISHLGPQFLHVLKGKYASCFAVRLNGNFRLIFEAYDCDDKQTTKISNATQVIIREVVDYHGN